MPSIVGGGSEQLGGAEEVEGEFGDEVAGDFGDEVVADEWDSEVLDKREKFGCGLGVLGSFEGFAEAPQVAVAVVFVEPGIVALADHERQVAEAGGLLLNSATEVSQGLLVVGPGFDKEIGADSRELDAVGARHCQDGEELGVLAAS